MDITDRLCSIVSPEQIKKDEPMSRHTTFRTGGNAEYFILPEADQIEPLLECCREEGVPSMVIGNGSNLLVSDAGIEGAVLCIGSRMEEIRVEGEHIFAQAGASLRAVAEEAAAHALTGLEFACGIPGTLGGALIMNAGAYGGEMKDVVENIQVLNRDGSRPTLSSADYQGGYRSSAIMRSGAIVLSAVLKLEYGNQEEIYANMRELREKRRAKQPLEYPSAGSTFKRPEGQFAGKLIQDAGLAGCQIGGAKVSEKHCGFIINTGNATSAEIRELMDFVIYTVHEKYDVFLDPEVRCVGVFE